MKKKFWALVLIAALVCCLLPPQPVVHAESTTAMNFENKNTDESGTGWSWNASSKTLSLSGLDFTCSDGSSLILPAGAIVNLSAGTTSTITNTSAANGSCVYSSGAVTFTGEGTLNVICTGQKINNTGIHLLGSLILRGGTVNVTGGPSTKTCIGIFIEGNTSDLSIESGKLIASSGACVNTSTGIKVDGQTTIYAGATLEATGGAATDAFGISYGLFTGSLSISGNLTATGGSSAASYGIMSISGTVESNTGAIVNATSADAPPSAKTSSSYAMYVNRLNVSGGSITATGGSSTGTGSSYGINVIGSISATGGTINAESGASEDSSYGIYTGSSTITIDGGKVTATAGNIAAGSGISCGVYSASNVIISSGTVTATGGKATIGDSYGIYSNTTSITGATVTAKTTSTLSDFHQAYNKMPVFGQGTYRWRINPSVSFTSSSTSGFDSSSDNIKSTYSEITWANSSATVSDQFILGMIGIRVSNTHVTVSLENDAFKNSLTAGTNVSSWFTNIPNGLSAAIKTAVNADDTSAEISFSGTPTQSKQSTEMTIVIPAAELLGGADILVTNNPNTKFKICIPLPSVKLSTTSPVRGVAITTSVSPEVTLDYKWYTNTTSSSNGGTEIAGQTGSSYTPTDSDVGKYIYLEANGTGLYLGTCLSVTLDKVRIPLESADLSTDSPAAGYAITAGFAPSGATVSYKWYTNTASSTVGGTEIAGQTGAAYTPTAADAGKYIYVVVSGTGDYTGDEAKVTLNKVMIPIKDVSLSTTVPITGSEIKASVLPDGATFTCQWMTSSDDGSTWTPISGQTGASYTPTNNDFGKLIKAVATGTGNYSGTKEKILSTPSKLSSEILPKSSFAHANAPSSIKFVIGTGVDAQDLGAASFGGLLMDGTPIQSGPDTYTVSDGSLVITFAQSYLNTLSVGKHSFEVTVTDDYAGTYSAELIVEEFAPITGDEGGTALWAALAAVSVAGALWLISKRCKRNAR